VTDYVDIPPLQHFVLEESYVVDVLEQRGVVELKMDLVFARDHPELLPARPGEWAYYREGVIRFLGVYAFSWTKRSEPGRDLDGSTAWGGIDTLVKDGHDYSLIGDFGQIEISAENIEVVFTGPA
jgi:hypothetical protein